MSLIQKNEPRICIFSSALPCSRNSHSPNEAPDTRHCYKIPIAGKSGFAFEKKHVVGLIKMHRELENPLFFLTWCWKA